MDFVKIVGVIPARYASSRFPGKPLADIHGKPMIWWVYQEAKKAASFEQVVVATDDNRIMDVCNKYKIEVIMTSEKHPTHIHRLHEISQKIKSDLYVCVCGDEPLTKHETMIKVIPQENRGGFVMRTLMREFSDPAEALDPSNIKVVANAQNDCMLLTRSMVPFPYKSLSYKFKKLVGIECYSRSALEFYIGQQVGFLEKIEDIALLRFIENHKPIQLVLTAEHQLGVDTPKDLEYVRDIIKQKIERGELDIEKI
jgi:3-deoxy-manno-octulosonate cytidylyltransferase (CMP-KDO synthetase)